VIYRARIEILQRQHADAEHQQEQECSFIVGHDVFVEPVFLGINGNSGPVNLAQFGKF
jgi:hypothetical protein